MKIEVEEKTQVEEKTEREGGEDNDAVHDTYSLSEENEFDTEKTTQLKFELENLDLRIAGPFSQERIGKTWREECMAMDRYI